MTEEIDAWHFTGATLRDQKPIPPAGEWLRHDGEIVICKSGLHASERLLDALRYAPGHMLHRVKVRGDIQRQDDKFCGRERLIVWTIDAEPILRTFARRCALDGAHLWDMPAIVREYLKTGREDIRDAAMAAAMAAGVFAAWAAVWAASGAAAWDAAWGSAWGSAGAAAMAKYNGWLTEMVEAAR